MYQGIETAGLLPKLLRINGDYPRMKWIEAVHKKKYIQRFETACKAGHTTFFCPDNQMCSETYDISLLAVGGILKASDLVMQGKADNSFCMVRPPGHHADIDEAMGFCYFNNIAVTAKYIQKKYQISKIGIIDFDVHHGNGTQHIFEHDPTVFYYSIHQHPSFAYPGTGREFEKGLDTGYGYTKNSPVLPGHSDDEYRRLFKRDLFPSFQAFKPEVLLVSAGFDGHMDDDMSDIMLTTQGFSWIMEQIIDIGNRYADGRIISILEGGYSLKRLPELAKNHVELLLHS
jgi:acetoin utilization deacetylase AcuC-like enzyme